MEVLKPILLRGVIYFIALALGTVGSWLAAAGYATYDAVAGTIDIHPINVEVLAAAVGAMIFGNGLALTAVIRGWGK